MSGHDNLDIRIQFQYQTDELLLPFEVKADFRLIHKEDIRLVVLHQHGKEDGENLLLTSRELIRRELLTYLVEADSLAVRMMVLPVSLKRPSTISWNIFFGSLSC